MFPWNHTEAEACGDNGGSGSVRHVSVVGVYASATAVEVVAWLPPSNADPTTITSLPDHTASPAVIGSGASASDVQRPVAGSSATPVRASSESGRFPPKSMSRSPAQTQIPPHSGRGGDGSNERQLPAAGS